MIAEAVAGGALMLPEPIRKLADVFCGCGEHESAWSWVFAYLQEKEAGEFRHASGAELVAVYLVDNLGLTEHGTSIAGGWLTPDGVEALAFLREHGADWEDKGAWIDSTGCSWGDL